MNLVYKQLNISDIKEVDKESGIIRAVISSGKPDRDGQVIDQASWNFNEYLLNPVVLWAHDHTKPAIAKTLEIGLNADGMTEAVIQFAINEYDFAKTVFNLYAGKFMRAFSVGFLPGDEIEGENGLTTLKNNILYEFSAVDVGADALALAKSKGVDVKAFENVEEKEGRVLSKKNRDIIQRASNALNEVLEADKGNKTAPQRRNIKMNYRKILNKAVRELIEAKK